MDNGDVNLQGSAAWLKARRKRIGGSEIPIIMGLSPFRTRYGLWLEKTGLVEPEDISGKLHVQRGVLAEPVARDLYNRQTGKNFVPKVWPIIEECLGMSDDGFDEAENELIEIKCMGEQAHEDTKSGVVPDYYRAQVIWNLGISGAKKAYFISCRPESEYELAVIEILPAPAEFEEMKNLAKAFWHLVETKTPPELSERDVADLSKDQSFEDAAKQYVKLSGDVKLMEKKLEVLKAELIAKSKGHPSVKCSCLKLTRYTVKGVVDYRAIPELREVDLELYRKPSTISFKITSTNGKTE